MKTSLLAENNHIIANFILYLKWLVDSKSINVIDQSTTVKLADFFCVERAPSRGPTPYLKILFGPGSPEARSLIITDILPRSRWKYLSLIRLLFFSSRQKSLLT